MHTKTSGSGLPRRLLLQAAGAWVTSPSLPAAAQPPALKVGPGHAIKTLAEAARLATDNSQIDVDAGEYRADVAVWPQNQLTLRAVGGRVRMIAAGANAQGKGIFVTRGQGMRIEGFDFEGATVPDHNGAGIRLERGSLHLVDCRFQGNEMGVLTSNDPAVRLEVENCEFGPPLVRGGGLNHNLYVGRIAHLRVTGSYFHHGKIGHLLKSRAAVNEILYNRLTDETGGEASYELEFPNGGQALVMGNLIQQSAGTQNPHMISFGAEGYVWPNSELHLIHNTLVDLRRGGGIYLRVSPGAARVRLSNNLLAGNPGFTAGAGWELQGNTITGLEAFAAPDQFDFALKPGLALRATVLESDPHPTRQYQHPHHSAPLHGPARKPGALQEP